MILVLLAIVTWIPLQSGALRIETRSCLFHFGGQGEGRCGAYDAGYLWLGRETGADLVTLDTQLEKAWRKL